MADGYEATSAATTTVTATRAMADARDPAPAAALSAAEALRQWELRGGPAGARRRAERKEEEARPEAQENEEVLPPDAKVDEDEEALPAAREGVLLDTIRPSESEDDACVEDPEEWAVDHPTFAIKVHPLGGGAATTVDIGKGSSATVRELKLAIMLATGVSRSQQQLTHDSTILSDDTASLASVGLEHGMSIILDQQEPQQLTELEIADIQEAYAKRLEALEPSSPVQLDFEDMSLEDQERILAAASPTAMELDLGDLLHRAAERDVGDVIVPTIYVSSPDHANRSADSEEFLN